jgi:hypothetical protein
VTHGRSRLNTLSGVLAGIGRAGRPEGKRRPERAALRARIGCGVRLRTHMRLSSIPNQTGEIGTGSAAPTRPATRRPQGRTA